MYNSAPKVSILIPTYNQDSLVSKAIESALHQDYQNLEVIVSDDCSTDDTEKLIQQYCNNFRFKYLKNKKNIGRVSNYRKLLYEYATGDWALMLDGDDYLIDKTYISKCVKIVTGKGKNNVVLVQAGNRVKNMDSEKIINNSPKINSSIAYLKGIDYFFNFLKLNAGSHCSTFYNRTKAIQAGFYSHDNISSDGESIFKLSLNGDVVLMKKIVSVWLIHNKNASQTSALDVHLENLNWISRCRNYAEEKYPDLKKKLNIWYKKNLNNYLISLLQLIRLKKSTSLNSVKDLKTLTKYVKKNTPLLFLNFKFLLYYIYTCFTIVFNKVKGVKD